LRPGQRGGRTSGDGRLEIPQPRRPDQDRDVDEVQEGSVVDSVADADRSHACPAAPVRVQQDRDCRSLVIPAGDMKETSAASPLPAAAADRGEQAGRSGVIHHQERLVELSGLCQRSQSRGQAALAGHLFHGHVMETANTASAAAGGPIQGLNQLGVGIPQWNHDSIIDGSARRNLAVEIAARNHHGAAVFDDERVDVAGQVPPMLHFFACLARAVDHGNLPPLQQFQSRTRGFERVCGVVQEGPVEVADHHIHQFQNTAAPAGGW